MHDCFSVNRWPWEIPLLYYYYASLYSVESCLLTLNLVNKTTLPGSNTEPRRNVAEFMQESVVFRSTCTISAVKKVHIRYLYVIIPSRALHFNASCPFDRHLSGRRLVVNQSANTYQRSATERRRRTATCHHVCLLFISAQSSLLWHLIRLHTWVVAPCCTRWQMARQTIYHIKRLSPYHYLHDRWPQLEPGQLSISSDGWRNFFLCIISMCTKYVDKYTVACNEWNCVAYNTTRRRLFCFPNFLN